MMRRVTTLRLATALLCFVAGVVWAAETNEDKATWASDADKSALDFGGNEMEKAAANASSEVARISRDIQLLKSDVISLNKDLRAMEERLLFPSHTRYSVFVSLTSGQFFTLESIKLKLDARFVSTHVYSEKQRQALLRGGVHKLFVTNLSEGKHTATAFITGIGPGGRAYKRAVELAFEKDSSSQYLEIAISDDATAQEPTFTMKQW